MIIIKCCKRQRAIKQCFMVDNLSMDVVVVIGNLCIFTVNVLVFMILNL